MINMIKTVMFVESFYGIYIKPSRPVHLQMKINLNIISAFLCGASKGFMKAFKVQGFHCHKDSSEQRLSDMSSILITSPF